MAGKRQHSIAEIKMAIAGSGGNKSLIASRLDCNRTSIYRYLKIPEIAEAFAAEDGTVEGNPQYPLEVFVKAIEGSNGIIATIARRIGCSRGTVENALERWPDLQTQIKQERESLVDVGESVIVSTMKGFDPNLSFAAAKYVTGTLGKERGWASRKELTGANGEALFAVPDDVVAAAAVIGIDLQQAWEKFLVMIRVQARQIEMAKPALQGGEQ